MDRDKYRFGGNRKKALERDGYTCVLCGMSDEQHRKTWGFSITVDHIDGQGRYSPTKNHKLDNLQTLCVVCHTKKDRTARDSSKYILDGRKRVDNSSGYRGVYFDKRANRWKAYIGYRRKKISIGYFDTPEDAYRAYKNKVKELYST